MAMIQTKIPFGVRKKRLNINKLNDGKENTTCERSPVKNTAHFQNGNKQSITNKCEKTDSQLKHDSTDSYSSDSDSEFEQIISSHSVRTPRRRKFVHSTERQSSNDSEDDTENVSSPPKRGKEAIEHHNADSKNGVNSPKTPSQFITRLNLNTPPGETVIQRDEKEKHLPPKRLFATGLAYQQVRQALQVSAPTRMLGREEHLNKLQSFLETHLTAGTSSTLYVSGPPGTGKTASLSKIMALPELKTGYKIINVNCTSMKSSGSIYGRIAQELNLKVAKHTEKNFLASIEKYLATNHKMILLVLDEIDQLDSKNQSVLYTIFEWPSKFNSKLVLIGIANALDLTDRILPRLQARLDLKPQLLHFAPYTKTEIVNILTDRLQQTGVSGMFPAVALQLLAGKVASTCGDVRRALDIGRRVIELSENQRLLQAMPLQPTMDHAANTSSPRKSPRKNCDSESVALKEVMAVLNSVYGTSQSLESDSDDTFPLQQKVVVSTLLLMLKKGNNKDITVGKLHEVYCRICKKKNITSVDQAEFIGLCQLVETRGILKLQKRKEARLSRVCLQWDEEEVCAALKDKQLLSSILNDTSCLK